MKLSQLLQIFPSIQALGSIKLPINISLRIGLLIASLQTPLKEYDTRRLELYAEFGVLDVAVQQYKLKPELISTFNIQHEKLIAEEVSVTLPEIKLSELGSISIEPVHLATLLGIMIVDDTKAPAPPAPPGV